MEYRQTSKVTPIKYVLLEWYVYDIGVTVRDLSSLWWTT